MGLSAAGAALALALGLALPAGREAQQGQQRQQGVEVDIWQLPKYDARYDYLDIDAILDSRRLVRNYADCLIGLKPCTPEGKALKRILPEALRTKCARCTEKQKRTAVKVIARIQQEYPEEWARLQQRWDPTGDFTRYFREVLAKEHFPAALPPSGTAAPGGAARPPAPTSLSRPPAPPPPPPGPVLPLDAVAISPGGEASPSTAPQPPPPVILNRFGSDEEEAAGAAGAGGAGGGNSEQQPSSVRPVSTRAPAARPTTARATTARAPTTHSRPASAVWTGATSGAGEALPTRFPLGELPPLYSTTMTIIDHLGTKLARTTDLLAQLLRSTVHALVPATRYSAA